MNKKEIKFETFVYWGLGFPIKLINAPLKKVYGEWFLDINMNKLQLKVLHYLISKATPLTGDELYFIRTYLNLTTADFGKILGVTHDTVVDSENRKSKNVHPLIIDVADDLKIAL